jgi:hypothetical protein
MATVDPLRIEGLRDFQRALRDAENGLQKQLRVVFNDAADIVVGSARPFIPTRTGALAGTLRAASGQRDATVALGRGKTTRYAGWVEFGGRRGRSEARRPFVKGGRSMYPAVRREEAELSAVMAAGLNRLADQAGL